MAAKTPSDRPPTFVPETGVPSPDAADFPGPDDPTPARCSGCGTPDDKFHSRWSNGGVYHAGFTTAWAPNRATTTIVPAGTTFTFSGARSGPVDADIIGANENDGGPTYAASTSRSYHPGGVNIVLADGSVRFIKSGIDGRTWRALGTVAGGEVVSADAF